MGVLNVQRCKRKIVFVDNLCCLCYDFCKRLKLSNLLFYTSVCVCGRSRGILVVNIMPFF